MTSVYFLLFLASACNGLIIDIDVGKEVIDVRHYIPTNIITDEERKTFGIDDAGLKKAIEMYTNDETKPDFVYVKNGKNDLYDKYGWLEVKRTVTPKYFDVKPDTYCQTVKSPESDILIRTNWTGDVVSVTDKIKYIIYSNGTEVISAENEWGTDEIIKKPKIVKEKEEEGYQYEKCVMEVKIDYETTIEGDVTADYVKTRTTDKGSHYFWAYELKDVQNAAKLKKNGITTEIISVTYYKKTKKA